MLRGKDISHDMVESLGHDMMERPVFHADKWREIKAARPGYADFIERRLTQLLGTDEQALRKALALVVEVNALEDKVDFAEQMAAMELVAPELGGLGNLAADEQLAAMDRMAAGHSRETAA